MAHPILHQENFLSACDFEKIQELCPKDGWQQAVVYDKRQQKEVISTSNRHAKKISEHRKEVTKEIQKTIMPYLLSWLKQQPHFHHVWFRYSHTQWIEYTRGMFFNIHQDFEKYVCEFLTPYVALLGLENTEKGGETIVGRTKYKESCQKNGIVFFPGNVPHQASVVVRGVKRCLKLECFVLFQEATPFMVCDDRNHWKSYWSKEQIELLENYMKSHTNFTGDSKSITVSSEMAQTIQNAMIAIASPYGKTPREFDMIFPNFTPRCLRDIFNAVHFIKNKTKKVYLGTDPDAWEYMNQWLELDPNYNLVVGLWAQNLDEEHLYRLHHVYHRDGQILDENKQVENKTFTDFTTLKTNILQHFIREMDLEIWYKPELPYTFKNVGVCNTTKWDNKLLKGIRPSDFIQPVKRSGTVMTGHYEMCNDEGGGITEYTPDYISYIIQIRWCLVQVN